MRSMNDSVIGVAARIPRPTILLAMISLFFVAAKVQAQSKDASSNAVSSQEIKTNATPNPLPQGVEILSDTRGVDLGPYVRSTLAAIKKNWVPLIPEKARPGGPLDGETIIRLTMSADGKITAMHLDKSSGHTEIDRAAWGAITAVGQFSPLPAEFKGPSVEFRISFLTNRPVPAPTTGSDHMTGGASIPK